MHRAVALSTELKGIDPKAHLLSPAIRQVQAAVDRAQADVDQTTDRHDELLRMWEKAAAESDAADADRDRVQAVEEAADAQATAEDELLRAERDLIAVIERENAKSLKSRMAGAAQAAKANVTNVVENAQSAVADAVESAQIAAEQAVEAAKANLHDATDFVQNAETRLTSFRTLEDDLIEQSRESHPCFRVDEKSLAYFDPENTVRVWCLRVIRLDVDVKGVFRLQFDRIMLLFVAVSSLVLALEGPPGFEHDPQWISDVLAVLDWACFVVFAAEFVFKGACLDPRGAPTTAHPTRSTLTPPALV